MKKGFALITVLAVLIIIGIGSLAILKAVTSHATMKVRNVNEIKAQYLAEAGMQRALWKCRDNNGVCVSEPEFNIDGTKVEINVTEAPAGSKTYQIVVGVSY